MLKKKYRLSGFNKIEGLRKIELPFLILKYKKAGDDFSKFAFIVSKKIDKRAVVRNSIKRKLQTVVAKKVEKIEKGYIFLFIAKREIINIKNDEISNGVEDMFMKIKLI